ncbi:MAG TPA: SAM-dependent methyltransferase [Polyangiaceae bacterium]|nr:SAM-dependent methyltransferase [Polyangiaceae bacterium]
MLSVSDTAFAIAAIRAQEGERAAPERLFADPYASIFVAAGAHAREGVEHFLGLPFFCDAIRLRTRFIDDLVRESSDPQLVLLGAGFDARALRIPEIAERGARVYEVDFSEQLANKRALLEAAAVPRPSWVQDVACDFNDTSFDVALEAALDARGFRRGASTLFVWEGVVAYLDDGAIDRTLRFIARTGGKGSRVVFDGVLGRFDPESAGAPTVRAGFARCDHVGFDALWRRYLPGEPHENAALVRMFVASV